MVWRSFAIRGSLVICLLFALARSPRKNRGTTVNINTATSEELQLVRELAFHRGKILQMRKILRGIQNVDDLLAIRGLGPKRLEKCADI